MIILMWYFIIGIFTVIRYHIMVKDVTKDYTKDNKHRKGAFSRRTTFWLTCTIVCIGWPYWIYKKMKSNLKYWKK